jgi:hypothetical protein
MELSELLQWLATGQKTGTLLVDDGKVEKRIYFRDGAIISSSSSDPREWLGHFLVSHGYISEEELERAISWQERARKLLGKILVDLGFLAEADLEKMLQLKAEESIFEIFSWGSGDFRFEEGQLPSYEMVPISLGVTGLLLEGMQRMDEWDSIRDVIPSRECVPVAVTDLERAIESLDELEEGQRQVIAAVNDDRSVEDICFETHASEFFVCSALLPVVRMGAVKIVRPRIRRVAEDVEDQSAASLLDVAEQHLGNGSYANALRHLRAAKILEPTDPDVAAQAERLEVRIIAGLEGSGVTLDAVPYHVSVPDAPDDLRLTAEEGFIMSRINGSYTVGSILKISPMPKIDALFVFWRLQQAGCIRLESPSVETTAQPSEL